MILYQNWPIQLSDQGLPVEGSPFEDMLPDVELKELYIVSNLDGYCKLYIYIHRLVVSGLFSPNRPEWYRQKIPNKKAVRPDTTIG